jgi:hypothetical protein
MTDRRLHLTTGIRGVHAQWSDQSTVWGSAEKREEVPATMVISFAPVLDVPQKSD